jgi:hypothetical protein
MKCYHCSSGNVTRGGGCDACWSCEDCKAHGCTNDGSRGYWVTRGNTTNLVIRDVTIGENVPIDTSPVVYTINDIEKAEKPLLSLLQEALPFITAAQPDHAERHTPTSDLIKRINEVL